MLGASSINALMLLVSGWDTSYLVPAESGGGGLGLQLGLGFGLRLKVDISVSN